MPKPKKRKAESTVRTRKPSVLSRRVTAPIQARTDHTRSRLYALAQKVGKSLKSRDLMLVTAESCTGGWIAQAVTMVPGSSEWFKRGYVTYTYISKREMLGVTEATLAAHGAVAEEVVREMAEGALSRSHAQVAVAVSGIAGPA